MDYRPMISRGELDKMTPPRDRLKVARDVDPIFVRGRESEKINNHNYGYLEYMHK
jgi:hypothetical protein